MILRWIELAGWRRFAQSVRIGPFSEGLNVLHAPNGTGKSTVFEALTRAMLDSHAVSGREVEALRPWGRALTPMVTVGFAHGGAEYQLHKRFLDQPDAALARREGEKFVPLAPGHAADEAVRAMLAGNAPGRGFSRAEHQGLVQVLWAPQGALALPRLSGDLVASVRQSLGEHVLGPGGGALEARIEQAYQEFYTPGGKLRSGRAAPVLVRAELSLREAEQRLRDALEAHAAFEEAARGVGELRGRLERAREDAAALQRALEDTRGRAEVYAQRVAERRERAEQAQGAEALHRMLRQQAGQVRAARRELREASEELARLQSDAPLRDQEVDERERDVAAARAALEDVRARARAAEAGVAQAERAQRWVRARSEREALARRCAAVERAGISLAERTRERAAVVAPDAAAMRAIREAGRARDLAQARLAAAMVVLELVPSGDGALTVITGEEPGARSYRAGTTVLVAGSPEVTVEIPGVGRVRARGPDDGVGALRAARDEAARVFAARLAEYGASDLDAVETLSERAAALTARVAEAHAELAAALGGHTADSLAAAHARAVNALESAQTQEPTWDAHPPDAEALRADAERARRQCAVSLGDAESRLAAVQSALAAAVEQRTTVRTQRAETERRVRALTARLAELTADGLADEAREAEVAKLALRWDAALARVTQVDAALAAAGDDPRAEVVKLARRLKAADDAATEALSREKTAEGRLASLAAQGTYSAVASAEEDVARLRADVAREELRARAVKLLRATVAQCRNEAVAAIAEPVSAAATRTFHRIGGANLGALRLGEAFEPLSVEPVSSGAPVSLGETSGGEQEQIHLATRLALAEVLARSERQLVVLDDALLATDARRTGRVLELLVEAAERVQVLVITCHPERYEALAGATRIDLEALVAAG